MSSCHDLEVNREVTMKVITEAIMKVTREVNKEVIKEVTRQTSIRSGEENLPLRETLTSNIAGEGGL